MITFRIEYRDNGAGYLRPWLVHADGRRRLASEEEAALWEALQAVQTAQHGETRQAARKK